MGGRGGGSGRGGGAGITSREYIHGIALEDKLFELHKNAFNALSTEEQSEILGEYYPNKLIVKNQKLCYKRGSDFSDSEKKILSSIGIEETDN